VGWEKVACWSTKAAISLKCVKIEEKLLWRAYRNSPMLFWTVPSPTRYGLLFPKIGGSQPPKLQSLLSQERVMYRLQILLVHSQVRPNKSPFRIEEKGAWVYPGTVLIFLEYPLLSQEWVKLRTSNFCKNIHNIDWNKSPIKISGKIAMGILRDSWKFSGHHIWGASRGHLCDSSAFLLFLL